MMNEQIDKLIEDIHQTAVRLKNTRDHTAEPEHLLEPLNEILMMTTEALDLLEQCD